MRVFNPHHLPVMLMPVFATAAFASCTDALQCSLNGKCVDHACKCMPQWQGIYCERLNLAPVERYSGSMNYDHKTGANISSWGGAVLRGDDGVWHMWSAEMSGHCGIGAWLANSVIVHSTSTDPLGLYKRQDIVFPIFSHEPGVARAPTGEFVMYFTSTIWNGEKGGENYPFWSGQPAVVGGSDGYCDTCSNGSTCSNDCSIRNWSVPLPTYMSWTKDPHNSSSWSAPVAVPATQLSPLIDSNLAPIILPNGSVYALWRNDDDRGSLHMLFAGHWKDPSSYVQLGFKTHPTPMGNSPEDPFVWQDADGHFHCLTHGTCGYHSFSRDGFAWQFAPGTANGKGCAFPLSDVPCVDGSTKHFSRRERPHLIFAADGVTPIALTTSVTSSETHDASFTLLQPIGNDLEATSEEAGHDSNSSSSGARLQKQEEQQQWQNPVTTRDYTAGDVICQEGGNQFRLVSNNTRIAVLSRTGQEGLANYDDGKGNSSDYNHDDFSLTVRVTAVPAPVSDSALASPMFTLRSAQDTTSERVCSLMSAGCSDGSSVGSLVYWCQPQPRSSHEEQKTFKDLARASCGRPSASACSYLLPQTETETEMETPVATPATAPPTRRWSLPT